MVPGVSGGTIAFMTGIYKELIDSLKSIDHISISLLFKGKFKELWERINGTFLLSLLAGIMISILSLARLMQYLLANHPIPLWSFFFGLVAASTILILKDIKKWSIAPLFLFVFGAAVAVWISIATPAQTSEELWFIFLCGMVAICAMILPGISGSFILVLMGKYAFMMGALNGFNIPVIITFIAGAAIGLISFSHFLSWLLNRFYIGTIALLAGFMSGSLVKVWPWKLPSESTMEIELPTLPGRFSDLSGSSSQLFLAILFLLTGAILVFGIEFFAKKSVK